MTVLVAVCCSGFGPFSEPLACSVGQIGLLLRGKGRLGSRGIKSSVRERCSLEWRPGQGRGHLATGGVYLPALPQASARDSIRQATVT